MKQIALLSLGLILFSASSSAQTNVTSTNLSRFVLPPIHLWEPASPQEETPKLALALPSSPQLSGSAQSTTLTATGNDDNEFHSGVIRSGQFYLTSPEPVAENRFVRAAESIWSPEVVKLGKTSISSPIITAIKRKNPLCLLNPLFFQASW